MADAARERDHLILQHQGLVKAFALQVHAQLPKRVELDELIALGNAGLVEAASRFDPASGVKFSTFAFYRVRGAILTGIRKYTWLPPALRKAYKEQQAVNDVREAQSADETTEDSLGGDIEAHRRDLKRLGAVLLASGMGKTDGDGDDALTEAAGTHDESPDRIVERRETMQRLQIAMKNLDPKHVELIRLYYFDEKPMSEIGRILGCDTATVSRRHGRAIGALADALGARSARDGP